MGRIHAKEFFMYPEVRLKKIMIFIMLMFIALAARLAYIQLAGEKDLSSAVRAQSLISLEGSNTRGIIYDRYGQALVADKKRFVYIIKDDMFDKKAKALLKELGASEVSGGNKGYRVYSSENYDKKTGGKLIENYNAYIMQASARYSDEQTAAHLIGYINRGDNSGAAGLELMFDDKLSIEGRNIYAAADVKGNILPGRGLIISSDDKKQAALTDGIVTTIDKDMQQAVEDIINEESRNCAVVVLDSRTGGIAAMACTPSFNPGKIDEYMGNDSSELVNKATQGEYAPGSVFKIVVAAAALEDGIEKDKTYTCTPETIIGDIEMKCETGRDEGHGGINFEEAFAQSCNSFFIQLGRDIGGEKITAMAEKMGFGAKALKDYPQEKAGHVMTKRECSGAGVGNLSIGQGQTLVTPLQVARMTNIIASGGVDRGVHILMEEDASEKQILSKNTTDEITRMMEQVTTTGTASYYGLTAEDGSPKTAVKTGTAEYGKKEDHNTHGWITGFTPCEDPEYVITVFLEGGKANSSDAAPVYKKIIEYLDESGSYSKPTLA